MEILRGYGHKTPANGVAVFVGSVEGQGKKNKFMALGLEPPQPLQKSLYYCGKHFQVGSVKLLYQSAEGKDSQMGIVLISGSETVIGKYNQISQTFAVTTKFSVKLPNHHKCGGFSQQRFSRQRDEAIHNYLRKISESCKEAFVSNNSESIPFLNVLGVVFAGPGELKNELVERNSDLLDANIKSNIIGVFGTALEGKQGVAELTSKQVFIDLQKKKASGEEQEIIDQFFRDMDEKEEFEIYAFGVKEVEYALKNGMIQKLMLHKDVKEKLFQKVLEAKKMKAKELVPVQFRDLNLEDVIVVGSASDRGTSIEKEYEGVCAKLFFKMNVQDLMEDEKTVEGAEVEQQEVKEEKQEEKQDEKREEKKEEVDGEWYVKRQEKEEEEDCFWNKMKKDKKEKRKEDVEGQIRSKKVMYVDNEFVPGRSWRSITSN